MVCQDLFRVAPHELKQLLSDMFARFMLVLCMVYADVTHYAYQYFS